jgi:hypothetical protein
MVYFILEISWFIGRSAQSQQSSAWDLVEATLGLALCRGTGVLFSFMSFERSKLNAWGVQEFLSTLAGWSANISQHWAVSRISSQIFALQWLLAQIAQCLTLYMHCLVLKGNTNGMYIDIWVSIYIYPLSIYACFSMVILLLSIFIYLSDLYICYLSIHYLSIFHLSIYLSAITCLSTITYLSGIICLSAIYLSSIYHLSIYHLFISYLSVISLAAIIYLSIICLLSTCGVNVISTQHTAHTSLSFVSCLSNSTYFSRFESWSFFPQIFLSVWSALPCT